MAIPSLTTVQALNRPAVTTGWYPGGFVDQFIRKISFERVDPPTDVFKVIRANGLPLPTFYGQDADLDVATLSVVNTIEVPLLRIGDTALVDAFQQSSFSNTNDVLQAQIEAKKIGIIRTLGSQIIVGTDVSGPPPQLKGLVSQDVLQSLSVTGDTAQLPTLEDLHALATAVRPSDGWVGAGADCLIANEQTVRYIIKLLESAAGGGNVYVRDPDLGVPVPTLQGLPIYKAQIPETTGATNENSIFALKLTGPTGVRVIHCPGDSSEFGIEVTPIPMQVDNSRFGAFVGGFYGLLVPECESVAVLIGTKTTRLAAAGIPSLPTDCIGVE